MNSLPEKYEILEPLVPGKNAEVFCALDKHLDQKVCLKIYKYKLDDPDYSLQEPKRLASLSHNNVIRILNVEVLTDENDTASAYLLVAMEMAEGGSLREMLDNAITKQISLYPKEALKIVADVSMGVHYIHTQGLLHRDIKPANIVLKSNVVKVADLGLPRPFNSHERTVGTKQAYVYRPPEGWIDGSYVVKSDIYQLGLVAYELVGGVIDHTALGKLPPDELKRTILGEGLVNVKSIPVQYPADFRNYILSLTGPESGRPESAASVAAKMLQFATTVPNICQESIVPNRELVFTPPNKSKALRLKKEHGTCWAYELRNASNRKTGSGQIVSAQLWSNKELRMMLARL